MSINRSLLREVILNQREEFLNLERGVVRSVLPTIRDSYTTPQIVCITGLRRVGKSTLLAQIADDLGKNSYYYLNFEDDRLTEFKLKDFSLLHEVFLELYDERNIFIFDEIQVIEGWEKFVRRLHNSGKKFFITGSNASLLSKEFSTKLSGRQTSFEVFPFSFREFLTYKNVSLSSFLTPQARSEGIKLVTEYLNSGGIPLALAYPKIKILSDLYNDVIYRDIVARYHLDSAKPIKELANYLYNNPATLQSFSKLKQLIQIGSVTTIKNYIDYLENSWLTFCINRYSMSVKQQQLAPKKLLCIDSGIINQVAVGLSSKLGRIFENLVFLELRRKTKDICYYITGSGQEVDFYLPELDLFVQVSLGLSDVGTRERELTGLEKALQEMPSASAIIVTLDERGEEKVAGKVVEIIASYDFFLRR